MIRDYNPDIKLYDTLKLEEDKSFKNKNSVFKKFTYFYEDSEGSNMVNIYAYEISNKNKFGIQFSSTGDYCINLTKNADRNVKGKLEASLNANFGLIVDELDIEPADISYNLHIEDSRLIQIPVADKSAILINKNNNIEIKFLRSKGSFLIDNRTFNWKGSLSKSGVNDDDFIIAYNSFNRGLIQIDDPVTKTKKVFDDQRSHTPKDSSKVDIIIKNVNKTFEISRINPDTHTHLFEGNLILSVNKDIEKYFKIGKKITNFIIDDLHLNNYKYGVSGGALLTPNVVETRKNLIIDRIVQTRNISGDSAFKKHTKFCRSCIVQDKDKYIFLLADARKSIKGQEGFSLYMLRNFIAKTYPAFINAVNVDGGNAPKLILKKGDEFDIYGNLHYKIWPKDGSKNFIWDGYKGRRIPAIIYSYY